MLTGSAVTAAETAVTGIAGNMMISTTTVMRFVWIRRLHHRNAAAAAAAAAVVVALSVQSRPPQSRLQKR